MCNTRGYVVLRIRELTFEKVYHVRSFFSPTPVEHRNERSAIARLVPILGQEFFEEWCLSPMFPDIGDPAFQLSSSQPTIRRRTWRKQYRDTSSDPAGFRALP